MLINFLDRQTIGSEIISEQRNSVGLLLGIQTSSKFHVFPPPPMSSLEMCGRIESNQGDNI